MNTGEGGRGVCWGIVLHLVCLYVIAIIGKGSNH